MSGTHRQRALPPCCRLRAVPLGPLRLSVSSSGKWGESFPGDRTGLREYCPAAAHQVAVDATLGHSGEPRCRDQCVGACRGPGDAENRGGPESRWESADSAEM